MSRPDYVPHEYADPILEAVRDACARTLYLSVYADAVDRYLEDGDNRQEDGERPELPLGIERAGPGEDWDDAVPSTGPGLAPCGAPIECVRAADDLLRRMARTLSTGWIAAQPTDRLTDPALSIPTGAGLLSRHVATWCEFSGQGPERFGHCLAMQAQGHGVGIDDDLHPNDCKGDPIVRLVAALRASSETTQRRIVARLKRKGAE